MKIGEFEIEETFKATNIGVILTGKIIAEKGSVKLAKGDKISFEFNKRRITRQIKGYETGVGRNINLELYHLRNIGILIECENDFEVEELSNWKPEKVMAELFAES